MAGLPGIPLSLLMVLATLTVYHHVHGEGKYDWMGYDQFDEINRQFTSVNGDTCRSKHRDQLVMRQDVVSQLPVYNQLLSRVWYQNRTALIHLHNMALNRAFFNSYILQRMNDSKTFYKQPNWVYFYFSAAADVNANSNMLNGSAFYFDNHCHYPNWYTTVPFNKTLPLYAPKAFRWNDYRDQDNYLRETTGTVVKIDDAGAGQSSNYTHPRYKMNPWFSTWLPDTVGDMDSLTKFTYYIGIKQSNETGKFLTDTYENYAFFGPSSPGASEENLKMLPVQWTPPYFDCGGSNKWVVSAVAPVVDYMPRYSNFTHMRRQRIVGLVVMDIDFRQVDFNSCGVSKGNPGPSYLSGIDRCKATTSCKHRPGFGFSRGGYVCVCKSGRRYPWNLDPPYLGTDIEQATEEEYDIGYSCLKNQYGLVLPVVDQLQGVSIEGAGIIINSGGLDIQTDQNVQKRKKRSTSSNVTETTDEPQESETMYVESDDPELGEERKLEEENDKLNSQLVEHMHYGAARSAGAKDKKRDYTAQELMELVKRLKEINDEKKLNKTSSFTEKAKGFLRDDIDDYAERNSVDVSIERLYEEDVKGHHAYKKILAENVTPQNLSLTRHVLGQNILRIRKRHVARFHSNRYSLPRHHRRRKRAAVFHEQAFDRMMRIFRQKASVTPSNCHDLPNHQLFLPGDVNYGVNRQFEPEGRTALRLTHFLSMYLQNVVPEENFGALRGGGPLHIDQMFGEVLANVMGNFRIYAAGLYFDRFKFENQDGSARELFGPWAFQKRGAYYLMDTAGLSSQYVDQDWFLKSKARFQANFHGVKMFKIRAHLRSDPNGTSSVRHEYYPLTYRAATYEHGYWTRPYFRCDGNVDAWVMTYVSPFFGLDSLRTKLEFRGVATVDVPLNLLEINQCPQPFTVANAFKNTARCDYFSTNCGPQAGFPFLRGSYTCKCRLGFEYWHADGKEWFEGSFVELEYEKKRAGLFSRFDNLYCRPALAPALLTNWLLISLGVALCLLL